MVSHGWNNVAYVLGYALPRKTIIDHVPNQIKKSFESLMKLSSGRGSTETERHNHNDKLAISINGVGCISSFSAERINKLRHSQIGFVQRLSHPLSNMDLTSRKKKLYSYSTWLITMKQKLYEEIIALGVRLSFILMWWDRLREFITLL